MCKCGNQGCKVREARGLVPFCQMARSDAPMLTLVTCYPFDAVVPGGPLRYVVTALAEKG